jgi:N-sulfoglucosamine sulfohydrolase
LETAGLIPPEKMTGRSLRHIFESDSSGKAELHREYVFAGKERHTLCRDGDLPYPQRSVRDVRFLYIRNYEPERWPAGSHDSPSVHGWIYGDIDESPSQNYLLEHQLDPVVKPYFDKAMSKRPAEELYDVIRDPACMNNLADSKEFHREKQSLSEVLQDYLEETGDPRASGQTSTWDNFPYYFKNPEGVVPYSAIKQEK